VEAIPDQKSVIFPMPLFTIANPKILRLYTADNLIFDSQKLNRFTYLPNLFGMNKFYHSKIIHMPVVKKPVWKPEKHCSAGETIQAMITIDTLRRQ